MADKVLKSLQPSTTTTNSKGSVQYAGIEQFTHTVLQLALHNNTSTAASAVNTTTAPHTHISHSIRTALSLLTQFAHSYTSFNLPYGGYKGELKPTKTGKDNVNNGGGGVLSKDCISSAVDILQQIILVSVVICL